MYHATPQTRGKIAHESVDNKTSSSKRDDILSLPVYSEELGVMGKIDLLKKDEGFLIERKYQLKNIYQGQVYQLWAQFFCLIEMGYKVNKLALYEISTHKFFEQKVPGETEKKELLDFIGKFRSFNLNESLDINAKKCSHCIYSALCDKTEVENVYS